MTEPETSDGSADPIDPNPPRRKFLGGVASVGAASALQAGGDGTNGNPIDDSRAQEDDDVDTHFEFGAEVDGWQGQSPSEIEGETNPTLDLQAGNQYRVTWENLDGVQHNFTLLDADGNEITSTETESLEGETRSLTFTATEEMDQYVCTVHPDQMRGDVQIGDEGPDDDTRTEDDEDVEIRFELGAVIGGWQGRLPEERDADQNIEGEQNPTLELEAGTRYMVVWENADGEPHNFTIRDGNGNDILATETTSNQGEKLSLTFTASEEMDRYVCTVHPETMQGDIEVSGDVVEEILGPGPGEMIGAMAAATVGFVAAIGFALVSYFDDQQEP